MVLVVKNLPASAGDAGDMSSIPGLGRFPGEGHGFPRQYSCLENPMDRGAWWVTVHGGHKESDTMECLSNFLLSAGIGDPGIEGSCSPNCFGFLGCFHCD